MLKWFTANINSLVQAYRLSRNTHIKTVRTAIALYWTNNHEITKDSSAPFVKEHAAKMADQCIAVLQSPDPIAKCREDLGDLVYACAQYQVLVLDPPPTPDPTGLRGRLGITGELKARIHELAKQDEFLIEYFSAFPEVTSRDDEWNLILMRYRMCGAYMNVMNALRISLDDCNPDDSKDWFKPFYAAMCASAEYRYRSELGLPDTLATPGGNSGDRKSDAYNMFWGTVLGGERFPDLEWRRLHRDMTDLEQP
jgi:hypothetical protein